MSDGDQPRASRACLKWVPFSIMVGSDLRRRRSDMHSSRAGINPSVRPDAPQTVLDEDWRSMIGAKLWKSWRAAERRA
jgi:hypothetical protein